MSRTATPITVSGAIKEGRYENSYGRRIWRDEAQRSEIGACMGERFYGDWNIRANSITSAIIPVATPTLAFIRVDLASLKVSSWYSRYLFPNFVIIDPLNIGVPFSSASLHVLLARPRFSSARRFSSETSIFRPRPSLRNVNSSPESKTIFE